MDIDASGATGYSPLLYPSGLFPLPLHVRTYSALILYYVMSVKQGADLSGSIYRTVMHGSDSCSVV